MTDRSQPMTGRNKGRGPTGADPDMDVSLASLVHGKKHGKKQGLRPRRDPSPPLVSDCVLHFLAEEPDPKQKSKVQEKQSTEITQQYAEQPIAKKHRGSFVWVCKVGEFFSMDPDDMRDGIVYEDKSQKCCDICGRQGGQLHEFRAFHRCDGPAGSHADRRLHSFISYISVGCGKGLLGAPSERSTLRAKVLKMLQEKQTFEDLAPRDEMDMIAELKRFVGAEKASPGGRALAEADAKIQVPPNRAVLPAEVFDALESFKWPPCRSRANVRPAGEEVLEAFCLGLVNSYQVGLTCSRMTRAMRQLVLLLVAFSRQLMGPKFTSIQCNRNYAARLHVDGNNLGPSWIGGLGEYEGGGLWLMNPDGKRQKEDDVPMTVAEPLKGYDFKPGDQIYGRVHDIKDKWFQFDGRVPHAALPFRGTRISLVFFCRSTRDRIPEEDCKFLEDLGFPLPDSEWMQQSSSFTAAPADPALKRRRVQDPHADLEEQGVVSEDEVDEDEFACHFADEEEPDQGASGRSILHLKSRAHSLLRELQSKHAAANNPHEEPISWESRAHRLRHYYGQAHPIPCFEAMRWVMEALAEKSQLANDIVVSGVAYLNACLEGLKQSDHNLTGFDEHFPSLRQALDSAGVAVPGMDMLLSSRNAKLLRQSCKADPRKVFGTLAPEEAVKILQSLLHQDDQKLVLRRMAARVMDGVEREGFVQAGGLKALTALADRLLASKPEQNSLKENALLQELSAHPSADIGFLIATHQLSSFWPESASGALFRTHLESKMFDMWLQELTQFDVGSDIHESLGTLLGHLCRDGFVWQSRAQICRKLLKSMRSAIMQLEEPWVEPGPRVELLQKFGKNIQDLFAERDELQVELRGDIWTRIQQLEDRHRAAVDERLQRSVAAAQALAHNMEMKRAHEEQQAIAAHRVGLELQALRRLVTCRARGSQHRLVNYSPAGFKELLQRAASLVEAIANSHAKGVQLTPDVQAALDEAAAAGAHFCEEPGRLRMAKSVLEAHGFSPQVIYLLDGLLERLPEVLLDFSILHDLCLPPRIEKELRAAAQQGVFKLESPEPPEGYKKRQSSSTGLYLLTPLGGAKHGAEHFDWRDVMSSNTVCSELNGFPSPNLQKETANFRVEQPYLVSSTEGAHWCRLCQEVAQEDHAQSKKHLPLKALWQSSVAVVQSMLQDFEVGLMPEAVADDEAVLSVWQAELLHELSQLGQQSLESDPEDVQQVLALFWLLADESWPSKWCDMPSALQLVLEVAQRPEPDLISYVEPPELGVDLPCFPAINQPLSKEATHSDVSKLTVLELLAHGMELQESGGFRCWYCEVDVSWDGMSEHILPYYKVGQQHQKNQDWWDHEASWLQNHGWRLRDMGIEIKGRRFLCACCPGSELTSGIEEHRQTWKHKNFEAGLSKAAPHVAEARRTKWVSAFEDAERKRLEAACARQESLKLPAPAAKPTTYTSSPPASASSAVDEEEPTAEDRQKAKEAAEAKACFYPLGFGGEHFLQQTAASSFRIV